MDHLHGTHASIREQLLLSVKKAVHQYIQSRIGGHKEGQTWTGPDDALVQSCLLEIFLNELHAKTLGGKVADMMKSAHKKRAESYALLWRYFNSLGDTDTMARVCAQVPEYDTQGRCRDYIRALISDERLLRRALRNDQVQAFYGKAAFLLDSDSVDAALSFFQGIWAVQDEEPVIISASELESEGAHQNPQAPPRAEESQATNTPSSPVASPSEEHASEGMATLESELQRLGSESVIDEPIAVPKKKKDKDREKDKDKDRDVPADSDEVVVSRKKVTKHKHHHSSKKSSPTPSRKSSRSVLSVEAREEDKHTAEEPKVEKKVDEVKEVKEARLEEAKETDAQAEPATPDSVPEAGEAALAPQSSTSTLIMEEFNVEQPPAAEQAAVVSEAVVAAVPEAVVAVAEPGPAVAEVTESEAAAEPENKETVTEAVAPEPEPAPVPVEPTPEPAPTPAPVPEPANPPTPAPAPLAPRLSVVEVAPSPTPSPVPSPSTARRAKSASPSAAFERAASSPIPAPAPHVPVPEGSKEYPPAVVPAAHLLAPIVPGDGGVSEYTTDEEAVAAAGASGAVKKHRRKARSKTPKAETAGEAERTMPVEEHIPVAVEAPAPVEPEMTDEERMAADAARFKERFKKHATPSGPLSHVTSDSSIASLPPPVTAPSPPVTSPSPEPTAVSTAHSASALTAALAASAAAVDPRITYPDSMPREEDEIFQNQRRLPFSDQYSDSHLLPTDRHAWSDESGKVKKVPSEYKPPVGWEWDQPDWHVDVNEGTDGQGWQYGIDFGSTTKNEPGTFNVVRRRRWVRRRVRTGKVDAEGMVLDAKAEKLGTMKKKAGRSYGPDHYVPGDATMMMFNWIGDGVKNIFKASSSIVKTTTSSIAKTTSAVIGAKEKPKTRDELDDEIIFRTKSSEYGDDFVDVEVDPNTCLHILSRIADIPPESTMEDQDNICPQCKLPIPVIDPDNKYEFARKCYYDGHWYCRSCHTGNTTSIPARILASGNFTKMPVNDIVYKVLLMNQHEPLFKPGMFGKPGPYNPEFKSLLWHINELCDLRAHLAKLTEVVNDCSVIDKTTFRKMMWPREYLLQDSKLFSMVDLHEIHEEVTDDKPTLTEKIVSVINFCAEHINHCARCTALAKQNNIKMD